jgi:hypothetical protein
MDLTEQAFFSSIRPFNRDGSQCFRAARVGKPADSQSYRNHSWVIIYGPGRGKLDLSMYKKGDYDIAVDPWPVAGKQIMSDPMPYEAERMDGPLLW